MRPSRRRQVVSAVAGILSESGYFHVEATADPAVKMFELIEQADEGAGIVTLLPISMLPSTPAHRAPISCLRHPGPPRRAVTATRLAAPHRLSCWVACLRAHERGCAAGFAGAHVPAV